MSTNADLWERRKEAVPRGVATIHERFADRANNAELWDVEGNRYVDFSGGLGVLNVGHGHRRVLKAAAEQMERYTHTCFHVLPYEPYVELAERLNRIVPGRTENKTLLVNSGAEAVENAVKLARAHTGRSAVIAFDGAFHGRTQMTLGMTGKVVPYKVGFGPFPADIFHAPFPMALHGVSVEDSLEALYDHFSVSVEPERVACIIIEPIQGESGFFPAPPEFLAKLRDICDAHGIVLIADEVQCGIARSGKMFAIEHSGVKPDLLVLGKSIADGFPLAAVVGSAQIMDSVAVGGVGGTYGGNPVACVAALEVLNIVNEEELCKRSMMIGQRLRDRLNELAGSVNSIGEIRNMGAMLAVELVEGDRKNQPATDLTQRVVKGAANKGLILLPCGNHGNVIRILVPLTVEDSVLDEGISILETEIAVASRQLESDRKAAQ